MTETPASNITSAEYYQAEDGWRWRAKGGNNEIVAAGEAYTTKGSVTQQIKEMFPWLTDEDIKEVSA